MSLNPIPDYRFSGAVRFLPWIGCHYHHHPRWPGRILILGEAHYADDDENRDLTRDVIRRQWQGESYAYFTRILGVLSSSDGKIDRECFWNTVAFYNYVQRIVSGKARVAPSSRQWSEAHAVLPEVLDALKPDYVLVTGKRLWENLPDWPYGNKLKHAGKPWDLCEGRLQSGRTFLSTFIYHPSSGGYFGAAQQWRGLIRQLFNRKPSQ